MTANQYPMPVRLPSQMRRLRARAKRGGGSVPNGRRLLIAGAVFLSLLTIGSPNATRASSTQSCKYPARRLTLYAEQLPSTPTGQIRIGYGLSPTTAATPGPTMQMYEGECLAITLQNDVSVATLTTLRDAYGGDPSQPLGVSLHVHGVKYTQQSDGTQVQSPPSIVLPGRARTYYWYAAPRVSVAGRVISLGTAGYWWYHDHVVGTDHGTGGLATGLWGGLIVRRPGDFVPKHTFVVAMGPNQTLNLHHYPDTDTCDPVTPVPSNTCYVATEGDRVEFLVIGLGDEFHTFHLHGHNWADNRTGIPTSQLDETRLIDDKTVGPAETFGFQVIAGEDVGPGNWMLHCHVQGHSDAGMVTFFHVLSSTGQPLPPVPPMAHVHTPA